MTAKLPAQAYGNVVGSLFMIASMAGFAVEDVLLKAAARTIPLGEVLLLFGLAGTLGFVLLTLARGERILHPAYLSRPILLRSAFEVVGRLFYALAFVLIPLTTATAILQAAPLVVVAGAALFLGEKVGWRRWLAIAVGFCGVMVILRPGTDGFDVLSLLAVAGMLGFVGRDLATRAAPPVLSNMQLGICGFAMLSVAGAILAAYQGGLQVPDAREGLYLLGATVFGVSAYYALTVAMRSGDVGTITPWRYTRLVFAMALAALVFGEDPDALTLIGSAIVVASGVFTLLRGRRKPAAPQPAAAGR
ncbi:MAG: DMT family transporter [Rhodobacterales bacterium]|nr:DMT family transporter [Rhodobacterales bacterium]NCT11345.1 DMT family transporter [Rhodobacterales bacterium]